MCAYYDFIGNGLWAIASESIASRRDTCEKKNVKNAIDDTMPIARVLASGRNDSDPIDCQSIDASVSITYADTRGEHTRCDSRSLVQSQIP